ncbi:hypothetical protein WDU94_009983 [Cyamophila willieti]
MEFFLLKNNRINEGVRSQGVQVTFLEKLSYGYHVKNETRFYFVTKGYSSIYYVLQSYCV